MKGTKKILTGLLAIACATSALAFTGCSEGYYDSVSLTGYESTTDKAESNGGFAVKKGGYIYFVNGTEEYKASNEYGNVVKGSLMRISEADFNAGKYDKTDVVVPLLFVAQNHDAGIFIYGDYVYFATPSTDKDIETGESENGKLAFKRAKLDGSEVMKGSYFQLDNNASNYRFVEENGTVYCLYEDGTTLKSYNTATGTTATLVVGASSGYYYDTDVTDAKVYYTMDVTRFIDSDKSVKLEYNQVYCVSASATATVDAGKASYTTSNGKTYDFDKSYMEKKNKEAKKDDLDEPYNFSDYATYPYVNLGELVLDGIGKSGTVTDYNFDTTSPTPVGGYVYSITTYQNDGVYFTREELPKTESQTENTKLYYLSDVAKDAEGYNAISANNTLSVVSNDTKYTTSSAIYVEKDGVHTYYYATDGALYKQTSTGEKVTIINKGLTEITLWKLSNDGNYLYFYGAGSNGNNISRVNVTGTQEQYNLTLMGETDEYQAIDEYRAQTLVYVDWNSSWYTPELFGDKVLFANAQSFGEQAYNYIYVANFGSVQSVKETVKSYQEIKEEINEATGTELQNAMNYYFRTGKTSVYEDVKTEVYSEKEQEAFTAFTEKFQGETPEYSFESSYIKLLGKVTDKDAEAMEKSWVDLLTPETEEIVTKKGLPTWAIVLIVVGSVVVVATAVLVPLLIHMAKVKAKKREEEATVNAYRRKKIDTTDDKSIDVYAEEETEEKPDSDEEKQE